MLRILRSSAVLVFALSSTLLAANSNADSKPVLMSQSGGGDTWSDLADLQRSAQKGNPNALAAYGEMLVSGDGVTKDVPGGVNMLERAAKAGNANAAFRLGKLYEDGDVIPSDAAKALEYYKQAALSGSAEAQYNLGAMYVSARDGLHRDFKEGLAWLIVGTKHGAQGEGEQRVRDRLKQHPDIIAAAEQRAAELDKQIAARQAKSGKK